MCLAKPGVGLGLSERLTKGNEETFWVIKIFLYLDLNDYNMGVYIY